MTEKTLKMIRIKWVRSGIGFTYHQKTIVRSLGLNKLNHTVVRPDTPQIRGIVASVPHLLEIIPEPVAPAWAAIPEYTVHAPVVAPATPVDSAAVETTETVGEEPVLPLATPEATESVGGGAVMPPQTTEVKSPDAAQEKEPSEEPTAQS